ncbi:MAG: hypothetical protein K9J17_03230 [Flavobacteriales bacterium]|nr:hypothetical protein [Flavobacteriales bacterium]
MSKSKDYIPGPLENFNTFQFNLNAAIQANIAPWNIPATEAATLLTWSDNFVAIYDSVKTKGNRTTVQVVNYKAYRKDYVRFLRGFVQSYVVNNPAIPLGTRVGMGLNPRAASTRGTRPEIETSPIPELLPLGRGLVRMVFKLSASDKRSACHPDSNGVEVFFRLVNPIVPMKELKVAGEELSAKDLVDAGFENMISTRAQLRKQFPTNKLGHTLEIYARWINTTDADKSGPFSATISMILS